MNNIKNFNKFIDEKIDESKIDDSGLIVVGNSLEDNDKIEEFVESSDYYGIWKPEFGHWFFPESEDNFDVLEKDLSEEFDKLDINARFEGNF